MVDGGGKGLSEGRCTASPSIRAYSRPEFPTRILSAERLREINYEIALGRTKRSSMFRMDEAVVVTAKA